MSTSVRKVIIRSAAGICTLTLAACGSSGIAMTEAAQQAAAGGKVLDPAAHPNSAVSQEEIRRFLAKQIADNIQMGNPNLIGRRRIVNAKISGPSVETDWLSRKDAQTYCVSMTIKDFYYGTIDREMNVIYRIYQSPAYLSAKATIQSRNCSESALPFREVEELTASLISKS